MFDVDRFVNQCREALRADSPHVELEEVLTSALAHADQVRAALGLRVGSSFGLLHVSEDLVIQRVVFPVGYTTGIHEHRLWTVTGTFAGLEQHDLYRIVGGELLEPAGQVTTSPGQTQVLAPEVAHSSTSVGSEPLGAIHLFVGDFFASGAGEWDAPDGRRREYSDDWLRRLIDGLSADDLLDP